MIRDASFNPSFQAIQACASNPIPADNAARIAEFEKHLQTLHGTPLAQGHQAILQTISGLNHSAPGLRSFLDAWLGQAGERMTRISELERDLEATSEMRIFRPKAKSEPQNRTPYTSSQKAVSNSQSLILPTIEEIQNLDETYTLFIPIDSKTGEKEIASGEKYQVVLKEINGATVHATITNDSPGFDFKQDGIDTLLGNLRGRGQLARSLGIDWSLRKTIRDLQQNFYDGHSGTLEGVRYIVSRDPSSCEYIIRIEGEGEYNLEKALTVGDSGKQTVSGEATTANAGKHGEGIPVLSLSLLRDHGANAVSFSSRNWKVDFKIPEQSNGTVTMKPEISGVTDRDGNYAEIRTSDPNLVEAILAGTNLFYHPTNPDFISPDFNDPQIGGFKLLGLQEASAGEFKRGNFYIGGQRFEVKDRVTNEIAWDGTMGGMHLWVSHEALPDDMKGSFNRERPAINVNNRLEMAFIMLGMLSNCSSEQLLAMLKATEGFWTNDAYHHLEDKDADMVSFCNDIITTLGSQLKLVFPENYLAISSQYQLDHPTDIAQLKQGGFVICRNNMSRLGMKTVKEHLATPSVHKDEDVSELDLMKLKILYEAINVLVDIRVASAIYQPLKLVDARQNPRPGDCIEIPKSILLMPFQQALKTFITTCFEQKNQQGNPENLLSGKISSYDIQSKLTDLALLWGKYNNS